MSSMEKQRKLVYVVEDDEEQLTLLRMILAGAGYAVVTESDADRVVAGVRQLQPHCVLLDVMLPSRRGADGFQLCVDIRNDPACKNVKIIIVSAIAEGIGSQREKIRAQVGADDYFIKPYDPAALVARIRELTS